jgi:hypothetical protein
MVQIGWNAGPHHAKVFGLAKSFTKKLDKDTLIDRDEDAVAALSIFWALVRALMPSEVVEHVEECLEKEGLPHLATRNVDEGCLSSCIPIAVLTFTILQELVSNCHSVERTITLH